MTPRTIRLLRRFAFVGIAAVVCVLTPAPELLPLSDTLGLSSTAEARPRAVRYRFVFGSSDKAQRNAEGGEALRARLRARLVSAQLPDHRTEVIDKRLGEVKLEVTSTLGREALLALLTRRGEASLIPTAKSSDILAELQDLVPDDVELVYGRRKSDTDVYFFAHDRTRLEAFASKMVLADYTLYVGPTRRNDVEQGFRTYLVRNDAARMSSKGMAANNISSHAYPNYYMLSVFYEEREGDGSSDKRELEGQAGLATFTTNHAGGLVLLVIDDELELPVEIKEPVSNGELRLMLPLGTSKQQHQTARRLAGLLSNRPHPCAIVLVRDESDVRK